MKTLTDILEARKLLKDGFHLITLDEFTKYVVAADDFDTESDDFKKVNDILTTAYGKGAAKSLETYVQKVAWKQKGDYENLYNNLLNIPANRIDKILGAGSFGTAFSINKNTILKRAHDIDEGFSKHEMKFYEFSMKQTHCPFFPRVSKLNKYLVVMEKLNMDTPKCRKYIDLLLFTDFSNGSLKLTKPKFAKLSVDKMARQDYESNKNSLNELNITDQTIREVYNWYKEIYKELDGINLSDYIDLSLGNIGERKDGTIVFFDAISDM